MERLPVESGCKLWDNYFTCPYPDCVNGKGKRIRQAIIHDHLKAEARKLKAEGYSISEIAERLAISRKTIYRYLKEESV